jgi:hypothetical protein
MDADTAVVTRQRDLGSSDTVGAFGAKCGLCHEILQFDVALRIKEPSLVVGNLAGTKTSTNF